MVRSRIISSLIILFILFALMVTVPYTFTLIGQVQRLIAEEMPANPAMQAAYLKFQDEFAGRLMERVVPYIIYILVLSLMVSIFFSRKMLLSLRELMRGARAISSGDLDIKLQASGDDELALVIRAFNEMAGTLSERTRDLQKKNIYVNAMLDPLWVVDELNRVTDINPAFTQLFGYERQEIIGASIFDFFDEENAKIVRNQLNEHREKGRASIYEVNLLTRDGRPIAVLVSGSPIMDDGKVTGKIGIFKDFREQKNLRSEIEQAKDYVETVVNSIQDQLLVLDKEYRIVRANSVALQGGTGVAPGAYCYEVAHGAKRPCWADGSECPAQSVFLTGRSFKTTHQHNAAGGKRTFHEIVASPIKDPSGNVIQVIELIRDVTDRVSHEEVIFMKNRELTALNSISALLSRSLRADEIFTNVLDRMIEMMKMDGGGIFFIDEQNREMVCHYHRGISDEYIKAMGRIRLGEDIPGKVAVTGQIMTTPDISRDAGVERSIIKHSGIKGYCCIPVRGKERIIGVFCLFSFKSHLFSSEEENILYSIGEMTGIALENIKLYEQMKDLYEHQRKRRDEEHGQLLSLTSRLGSAIDLRYVTGEVLDLIRGIFQADYAWLLAKDISDNYSLRAASNAVNLQARVIYPRGVSSIEGYAAQMKTPTVISDIRTGMRYYVPEEISTQGYRAALAVPMYIGEKAVGVFTLYYHTAREFRDEEIHFLTIMANMLAVSLERYEHYLRSISEKGISETILQSVSDGIVTVDTKGRMIAINRAFEKMTGLVSADAVGRPLCDSLRYSDGNADMRLVLGESLEAALAGEAVTKDSGMTTVDGTQLAVLISSAPVFDTAGHVTGVVNLIRNVSKEREIDRMKSEIVRSVSHEFRTPLSAIVGMTEMILDGDIEDERATQYLTTIHSEGLRLAGMVSDLLSIARIESGMEALQPERIDIKVLLQEMLASLGPVIEKKGAVVEYDLDDDGLFIGDVTKLKMILLNVIDNALNYSDRGCRLAITFRKRDDQIEITVKDNGWGIAEEDLAHITERFYRGRHGNRIKGTGLGLFLCNEIIRLYGGRMDITSRLGIGTDVFLVFPELGFK